MLRRLFSKNLLSNWQSTLISCISEYIYVHTKIYFAVEVFGFVIFISLMFVCNLLTCLLGAFACCVCCVGGLLWFLQASGGQNHSTSLR